MQIFGLRVHSNVKLCRVCSDNSLSFNAFEVKGTA